MKLPKFIEDMITEPGDNNHTVCPVRITAFLGVLQYLGLTLAHYIQHSIFEPQAFAVGFGALIGGVGVALGLKKDSSKDPNAKP